MNLPWIQRLKIAAEETGERIPLTFMLTGVWFAVTLHTVWACLLFVNGDARHATALYSLARLWPARIGLALVLLAVAACATYALLRVRAVALSRILLLIPQQLVLGVSAAGAVRAMVLGHFADGIARPTAFIVADQLPAVLALFAHSATIVCLALVRRWD